MQSKYTIDANGKSLGRVASSAAKALMGKTESSYVPHQPPMVHVTIVHASKLHVPLRKRLGATYVSYSGYPGGLKKETRGALIARRGYGEALRRAVKGMLPRNRLLKGRMKRLTVK